MSHDLRVDGSPEFGAFRRRFRPGLGKRNPDIVEGVSKALQARVPNLSFPWLVVARRGEERLSGERQQAP
jgi:hypothetical protein